MSYSVGGLARLSGGHCECKVIIIAERTAHVTAQLAALKQQKHDTADVAAREAIDLQLVGADWQGGLERQYRSELAEVLDEMAVMLERVFEEKAVEIDWRAPD